MIRLERVTDTLPAELDDLRREARANGHHMLDTLANEWASGQTRFDRPGEQLLAAHIDDALGGIGGLTLEPAIADAFRMRRFYVGIAFRRHGVGRALAQALLEDAVGRVVTANAAVGSEVFWESLGFAPTQRDGYTHVRC